MTRQTVSIANAHDGLALTAAEADELVTAILYGLNSMEEKRGRYVDRDRLCEVLAILRGKRRDGSEPGDAA